MIVWITREQYTPTFGGRCYLYWMLKRPHSRRILAMAREKDQALRIATKNGWVVVERRGR